MVEWLINARGDQILTVVAMIWLIAMTIKVVIEEKKK